MLEIDERRTNTAAARDSSRQRVIGGRVGGREGGGWTAAFTARLPPVNKRPIQISGWWAADALWYAARQRRRKYVNSVEGDQSLSVSRPRKYVHARRQLRPLRLVASHRLMTSRCLTLSKATTTMTISKDARRANGSLKRNCRAVFSNRSVARRHNTCPSALEEEMR